jgi:hypothetical protein
MAKKTVQQETQEIENGESQGMENGELKIGNEGAVEAGAGETNPSGDGGEAGADETKPDGDGDETAPKEVVVDVSVEDSGEKESGRLKAEARRIMQGRNAKRVWRCPKKGYWFTKKDAAEQHAREQNVTLKLFERED